MIESVAHEVFHCFQAALFPNEAAYDNSGDWLSEGSAEWAAAVAVPTGLGTEEGWWGDYLTSVDRPLFARTYDAIGFFSHLDETGIDPWSVLPAMFAAGSDLPAFTASGADNETFMTSWASGYLRDPSRSPQWDTTGPGIGDDHAEPSTAALGNGAEVAFQAAPYAGNLVELDVTADVVTFQAVNFVSLNDRVTDVPRLGQVSYCTKPGGCGVCPDNTPLPDDPQPLAPDPMIAVTSDGAQSSVSVIGQSAEDYCSDHRDVWVHLERPATDGVLAGTVVELYGCQGPFGAWQGVLRTGGLDAGDGFTVDFAEIPVQFVFAAGDTAQTAHATAAGNVPTPVGNFAVDFSLNFDIDAAGTTMSITGSGTASSQIVDVSQLFPAAGTGLPIEPAPAGSCGG